MRLIGTLLIFCIYNYCAEAAVKRQEGPELPHRARREIKTQCQESKIVVNPTSQATNVKIVTNDGNTLFRVDSTNTRIRELDGLISRLSLLLFPEPGYVLKGNSSDFWITKQPNDNGVLITITDTFNETILTKEVKDTQEENKNPSINCAHINGFKIIIDPKVDVNLHDGYNMTPLAWASMLGETEVAKDLLERGAYVHPPNSVSALGTAALTGKTDLLELLIKHGAKVNEPIAKNAGSALHIAAYKGRVECIRTLLKNGANVAITEPTDGATPLHFAITEEQLGAVKELVAHGADINAKTKKGMSPLHLAAVIDNEELIHFLLQSGADINSKTNDNATPLMWVVKGGPNEEATLKMVKHLIEHHKPDVNAKDNEGNSALSLASSRGFKTVEDYLKAHGAA